ncbi:MAG: cellulase N-terminal Ig-like domain-containing protein, partial [Ktedonobacteraceae bacterium]
MHISVAFRLKHRFSMFAFSSVLAAIMVAGTLAQALASQTAGAVSSSAFVRVNQVGYATGASKRAYLMASGLETGATFSVSNSHGAIAYSASIGKNPGSWS